MKKLDKRGNGLAGFLFGHALGDQAVDNIFFNIEMREESVVLKDHSDPAFAGRSVIDIFSV